MTSAHSASRALRTRFGGQRSPVMCSLEASPEPRHAHSRREHLDERGDGLRDDRGVVPLPRCGDDPERQPGSGQGGAEPGPSEAGLPLALAPGGEVVRGHRDLEAGVLSGADVGQQAARCDLLVGGVPADAHGIRDTRPRRFLRRAAGGPPASGAEALPESTARAPALVGRLARRAEGLREEPAGLARRLAPAPAPALRDRPTPALRPPGRGERHGDGEQEEHDADDDDDGERHDAPPIVGSVVPATRPGAAETTGRPAAVKAHASSGSSVRGPLRGFTGPYGARAASGSPLLDGSSTHEAATRAADHEPRRPVEEAKRRGAPKRPSSPRTRKRRSSRPGRVDGDDHDPPRASRP